MSNIERADNIKVDLSPTNPFGLTLHASDKNRSLSIEEPKNFGDGTPIEAQDLLRTVLLAHLTSKYFPKIIETNFDVKGKIFLDELYKHYGYGKPKIVKGRNQIIPGKVNGGESEKTQIKYVNAHSGGLDSIWRVAKMLSENKKVMMAHIRNLNRKGANLEAEASSSQAQVFNIPYVEVRLINGSEGGFGVMRTRDMLVGLIGAMIGEKYGSQEILVEGDMQRSSESHFSENTAAWIFFNKLIKQSGLNSQVTGMDAHDIETIGQVLKLEKELGIKIIPLVQNCFTGEYWMGNNRRKWERETPEIAKNSSDQWCGSCIKCRRMTLGRLFYEDPRFIGVSGKEISYFIENTKKWMVDYPGNHELISESFLDHLARLQDRVR